MCRKLKSITFVFENCDSISIDGKYVGEFLVDDIGSRIKRTAINSIKKLEFANTFVIEIHKDANIERYEHDVNEESFKQMTFDRFLGCDIVSVKFDIIEDNLDDWEISCSEHYKYYIDWCDMDYDDDDDYNIYSTYYNQYQQTHISKAGNLYIVISKYKDIEDFFDMATLDDEEYMKAYWELMSTTSEE